MKSKTTGAMRLLNEVCYVSRKAEKRILLTGEVVEVVPTFAYNPDSKTAPATAERWANGYRWSLARTPTPDVEVVREKNDPTTLWIIDLEVRNEGGRAYRVIDEKKRLFDLREDQLLEALRHRGVLAGGQIVGQFVWGILGSAVRLVLVGGDQHSEMKKQRDLIDGTRGSSKSRPAITPSSLVVGHVYARRSGAADIFLGACTIPTKPGKKVYAFLGVPMRPDFWPTAGCEHYHAEWKARAEINNRHHAEWDKLSWADRIDWFYVERFRHGGEVPRRIRNVCFITSPAYDTEVPCDPVDIETIDGIRRDTKKINGYGTGTCYSIIEDEREKRLGSDCRYTTNPNEEAEHVAFTEGIKWIT